MIGLTDQRDCGADRGDEERRRRLDPGRRRCPPQRGIDREPLRRHEHAECERGAGRAAQIFPVVREDQDDAAADEQRADRGEQDLAEPSRDPDGVGRSVMSPERLRRICREDPSIDQGGQLTVEPRDSAAHPDIMRDTGCGTGQGLELEFEIRNSECGCRRRPGARQSV